MRKKLLLLVIVCILVFGLSACDTGVVDDIMENEEDLESVEGSIVGGLSDHYLSSSANVSSQNNSGDSHNYIADEIWAFPVIVDSHGFIDLSFLKEKIVFPVEDNGNFNIEVDDLPDSDRFLFVLADSEAESRKDRILDFVSIKGNNNLRTIPAKGITEEIALGNLNKDNDEAVSTIRLEELRDKFMNHSIEALEAIAATDNALKALKNYYVNYNEDTGEEFSFSFSYASSNDVDDIINNYNELDSYNWEYPLFSVRTNMGDSADDKKLVPPSGSNNSTLDLGVSDDSDGYYSYFGTFEEEISEGFWTLEDSSNELGYFDFSFQLDFDNNDIPLTVIPSIKLNTKETNADIIESISVKWYFNSSDGLTEVKDLDIIEEIVMGAFLQFDGVTVPIEIDQEITEFDTEVTSREDLEWSDLTVDNFGKMDYRLLGISFELFFDKSY